MFITDMHCHVLPGVDDGPATMKESLATLKRAKRQDIRRMIVTPHFHPGRYLVTADRALDALDRLRRAAADEGIEVRLYPGQECYYYSGLVAELEAGNVLTMNGTRYVLVEFDPNTQYSTITYAVRELRDSGYKPIIAHFERYRCLNQHTERLSELRKGGARLQMNFERLIPQGTLLRPNEWRRLLREGYVDFLGSDTHGIKFRPLHADLALDWLIFDVEPDLTDRILKRNIKRLMRSDS